MRRIGLSLASLLVFGAAVAASGRLEVKGVSSKDRSIRSVEASILRADADSLRSFYSRDAVYVLVAPSRADWARHVEPGLAEALGPNGGPQALARFVEGLPSSIRAAGPDVSGARVRVELPGDRGDAFVAAWLPDRLARSRSGAALLDQKRPNAGLYLAGVDVKAAKDSDLVAVGVPGHPQPINRGRAPAYEPRELPGGGRGDLVVFAGKGASGSDAEDLRADLRKWLERDTLSASRMRAFSKEDDLAASLLTVRTSGESLLAEDGAYRALVLEPKAWEFERSTGKHPTRYVAVGAPVVAELDGRSGGRREVIVGFVGLYTPLFLTVDQAATHTGESTEKVARAIHEGELPFLRHKDDVLLYRAHVDRWQAGRARTGGGKERRHKEAAERAERWAGESRSRGLAKAVRQPLPQRMVPIPADERDEMVDRRRATRGRVYADDLAEWLTHHDGKLDQGGPEPVWALRTPLAAADLTVSFGAASDAVASRDGSREPESRDRRDAYDRRDQEDRDRKESSGDAFFDELLDDEEPRPAERSPKRDEQPARGRDEAQDFDDWGGGPATLASLEIFDFYAPGSCTPGGTIAPVLSFFVDGGSGSIPLVAEWDLFVGGRNVSRDAVKLERASGAHDFEFDVPCPDEVGEARLELLLLWPDRDVKADASTDLLTRGRAGRSFRKLTLPSARRCLDASFDLDGDEDFGMATTQGLSPDQIRAAVPDFQEETLRCHPAEGEISGSVDIALEVGCDGRVTSSTVEDDRTTDGTGAFAACVAETFKYAAFPAHDQQGGVVFTQPLRYD